MANQVTTCRTNSFRVKDDEGFKKAVGMLAGITLVNKDGSFVLLGASGNSWPSEYWDESIQDIVEIDFTEFIALHLSDGEVAIFIEVGNEKHRCLFGYAEAINNKLESRMINLANIYELAIPLGQNITHANS